MGSADDHIRVSERVKEKIDRRRREGESYNDALDRVLNVDDRDLLAGFGRWSDDRADRVRDAREAYERKSEERMRRGEDTG